MNQQRGRRWVAASEHEKQKKENIDRFIEMETDGWIIPDEIRDTLFNIFDSGSITPGTIWMERVCNYLKYRINERMNNSINIEDS